MHSVVLLLVAGAALGCFHAALPDHWVPIAVVARANRWPIRQVVKTSLWAGTGHVVGSLLLGVLIIAIGFGVQSIVAVEGKIVGLFLVATGIGFLAWGLWAKRTGRGHHHHPHGVGPGHAHGDADGGAHGHDDEHAHDQGHEHEHDHGHVHPHGPHEHAHGHVDPHGPHDHGHEDEAGHPHDPGHPHEHDHDHAHDHGVEGAHHHGHGHEHDPGHVHPHGHDHRPDPNRRPRGWAASLAVPFGVAASPDLTILPVFLAASAVGLSTSISVVVVFSVATIATFVALTVAATLGGYRVEWPWLEQNAEIVSAVVLMLLGVVAYLEF